MSKVIKGEVLEMSNSAIVSALKEDIADSRRLEASIKNFVNNSSKDLTGPNYDLARELMAQYIPVLERRAATAEQLADAIKNGCKSMASYMSPFAILDDAERAEYEKNLRQAQATLDYLNSLSWKNSEFNIFNYWNTYFSCKRIIRDCQLYLEKLDGLSGADASAYGPISAAASTSIM